MMSAPRSASIWVPKGPAPNWDTARMRSPSSGGRVISVGEPPLAERRVALLRNEYFPGIRAHGLAALVDPLGGHRDDAAVALARLPQREHAALRVEGVADECRLLVLELVHLEVRDGPLRDVGHRHADHHAVDQRAQDHALLVLGVGLGVVSVGVERMLVHREQREPRAVRLGDGAAGPMGELLTDRELFVEAAVAHGVSSRRAAILRRSPAWSREPTSRAAASR